MAYNQRNRVLTLLTGLGADFDLITATIVDEAIDEANRMVQHRYAPHTGFEITITAVANPFEMFFIPHDDVGFGYHVNEITNVTQTLTSPSRLLVVPIHAYSEVRWMQNTEGLISTNGECKMCGIRKQRGVAGTHDTGVNFGYDGGIWRIAIYPRCSGNFIIHYSVQAWDFLTDPAVNSAEQRIFMLDEAVRIAAAVLAPKAGLKPPQIETLLVGTEDWMRSSVQQIHGSHFPWARTPQQAVMG